MGFWFRRDVSSIAHRIHIVQAWWCLKLVRLFAGGSRSERTWEDSRPHPKWLARVAPRSPFVPGSVGFGT